MRSFINSARTGTLCMKFVTTVAAAVVVVAFYTTNTGPHVSCVYSITALCLVCAYASLRSSAFVALTGAVSICAYACSVLHTCVRVACLHLIMMDPACSRLAGPLSRLHTLVLRYFAHACISCRASESKGVPIERLHPLLDVEKNSAWRSSLNGHNRRQNAGDMHAHLRMQCTESHRNGGINHTAVFALVNKKYSNMPAMFLIC